MTRSSSKKKQSVWGSLFGSCLGGGGGGGTGSGKVRPGPRKYETGGGGASAAAALRQRLSLTDVMSTASDQELSVSLVGSNLHVFTMGELKAATQGFLDSNFLGEGGFGPVYKGAVDDKAKPGLKAQAIAVKLWDPEGAQGHKEWLSEVIFLGQLRHPNLVKLIGYCSEEEHRLLVYEYMAKGSLENHLFKKFRSVLSWSTRLNIAVGAAKGLAFLHDAEQPVIYRDFKTSNILLDPGEINSIQGVHAASKCCKEVDEFIGRNAEPFITISSEKRNTDQSHHFLKKFRARACLSYLSWICCGSGCSSSKVKRPSCCCCSCGALERLCCCCCCCRPCRVGCVSCCRAPSCCSPCSVQWPRCSCSCACPFPRCSCACPRCSATCCIPRCCVCL